MASKARRRRANAKRKKNAKRSSKRKGVQIGSSQVFNVYTEVFRGYNSAILNKETNRILNIIT